MGKIVFITGGQRSGKSKFAQANALGLSDHPVYLATAHIWDDDFQDRVKRHRHDRSEAWETIEEEVHLGRLQLSDRVVVLDCVTLWLTNLYQLHHYDVDATLDAALKEWDQLRKQACTLFVVSNELGMGIHAENEASRKFADLQGWMNQRIAADADEVFLMVSGLPLKVK